MKLLGPDELTRIRSEITDPKLSKKFDKAIGTVLDEQVKGHGDERVMRRVAFYVITGIFAGATIVTVTMVVLASLKVIELEDRYLDRLWTAFVVEMVGVAVWLVKRAFSSGKES